MTACIQGRGTRCGTVWRAPYLSVAKNLIWRAAHPPSIQESRPNRFNLYPDSDRRVPLCDSRDLAEPDSYKVAMIQAEAEDEHGQESWQTVQHSDKQCARPPMVAHVCTVVEKLIRC
jgi:hypothetical protein